MILIPFIGLLQIAMRPASQLPSVTDTRKSSLTDMFIFLRKYKKYIGKSFVYTKIDIVPHRSFS